VTSAFSGSLLPQEHNINADRLTRQAIFKGFKAICKLFLVCIRIPGENLKEGWGRIKIRIIAVNVFCYFVALNVV
jgi:hypothetical protein